MTEAAPDLPIDPIAAANLAEQGLDMALVDLADDVQLRAWLDAESRGFLDGAHTDAVWLELQAAQAGRRVSGIWDSTLVDPEVPVATITSWPTEMTLPGGVAVPAWAISGVSVAPTHRRRGIARQMLESELRTTAALGLPYAILTVSESTIYGRYGFAAAADAVELVVDARTVSWTGPIAPGRLQFVDRDRILQDASAILDRTRLTSPGEVAVEGFLYTRLFGRPSDAEDLRKRRFVRYEDVDGTPQGYVVYSVAESEQDFGSSPLTVYSLAAATPDAYNALWRFLIEHDLVGDITAKLRPVDEPLRWLVSDQRSLHTRSVKDHLWVRMVDPIAALSARTYAGPATIALTVSDPLDYADDAYLLSIDADGVATVTVLDGEVPDGAAAVSLDIGALGALSIGGASAVALATAGRVSALRAGSIDVLDRVMRSTASPWLSTWF